MIKCSLECHLTILKVLLGGFINLSVRRSITNTHYWCSCITSRFSSWTCCTVRFVRDEFRRSIPEEHLRRTTSASREYSVCRVALIRAALLVPDITYRFQLLEFISHYKAHVSQVDDDAHNGQFTVRSELLLSHKRLDPQSKDKERSGSMIRQTTKMVMRTVCAVSRLDVTDGHILILREWFES